MIRDLVGGVQQGLERHARSAAWATLVVNMAIVVTGGLVRLTGSGLGCPTWPQCQAGSLVPHGSISIHKAIEFSNRMVTPIITIAVLAALIAVWRMGQRRYALWILAGVAAQAVLGGITVRIELNPWIVSAHLIVSMIMIAASAALVISLHDELPRPDPLAWAQFIATFLVLALGTVVTGAGPHAGDEHVKRNGLSALQTAQLHADAVFLLCGLTIALVVMRRSTSSYAMLGSVVANGAIGFIQYFTHLPIALVAVHMLGATVVTAASTWVLLDRQARPDHRKPATVTSD